MGSTWGIWREVPAEKIHLAKPSVTMQSCMSVTLDNLVIYPPNLSTSVGCGKLAGIIPALCALEAPGRLPMNR